MIQALLYLSLLVEQSSNQYAKSLARDLVCEMYRHIEQQYIQESFELLALQIRLNVPLSQNEFTKFAKQYQKEN